MKNMAIRIIVFSTLLFFSMLPVSGRADGNYGAAAVAKLADTELNISKMLTYAIEDEYMSRGEYEAVMEKFGKYPPFSNIIKAEKRHVELLLPLFKKYNVPVPPDRGRELAKVPATFNEALQLGVKAEIENIAIYKRFLRQDLPNDVKDVFQRLLAGSENHLAAFQKGRGSKHRAGGSGL